MGDTVRSQKFCVDDEHLKLLQVIDLIPWYLDSTFSSFRNLDLTSAGSSATVGGLGGTSSAFSFALSAPAAVAVASAEGFSSIFSASVFVGGTGVPARDGSSESSSITNAVSNSEGSGPRVPSSTIFGFARLLVAGDSFLADADVLEVDAVLTGIAAALERACSSAILESIAPLSRLRL